MKIQVTQQHIDESRKRLVAVDPNHPPKVSCNCPIVVAMEDAGFKSVEVGGETVSFISCLGHGVRRLNIPWNALEFVVRFDNDQEVKPFEFELDV